MPPKKYWVTGVNGFHVDFSNVVAVRVVDLTSPKDSVFDKWQGVATVVAENYHLDVPITLPLLKEEAIAIVEKVMQRYCEVMDTPEPR